MLAPSSFCIAPIRARAVAVCCTTDLEGAFANAPLPEQVRSALNYLRPALLNRYQRHYFQSADGRFRLTVDSGLQFAAARQAKPGVLLRLAANCAIAFLLLRCS